jgi:hypothetical protein
MGMEEESEVGAEGRRRRRGDPRRGESGVVGLYLSWLSTRGEVQRVVIRAPSLVQEVQILSVEATALPRPGHPTLP